MSDAGGALIPETPSAATVEAASGASHGGGIVQAAGINALGNVFSRILGLVREAVVAGTFGVSGATSAAFSAASLALSGRSTTIPASAANAKALISQ